MVNIKQNTEAMLISDLSENASAVQFSNYLKDKDSFYYWLKDSQHMAKNTCKSYVSAIRIAEQFAEDHRFLTKNLYTKNVGDAKATADALFTDQEFIQYNIDQHNRFRAAITKLFDFYGFKWSPPEQSAIRLQIATISRLQTDSAPTLDMALVTSFFL